jgi:hypothetical protein
VQEVFWMAAKQRPARDLTQEKVLDLLVAPIPLRDVPQLAGVSRGTIWRWLSDPGFQSRLEERRRQVFGILTDEVRKTALLALARTAEEIRGGSLGAAVEFLKIIGPAVAGLLQPRISLDEDFVDPAVSSRPALPEELALLLEDGSSSSTETDR